MTVDELRLEALRFAMSEADRVGGGSKDTIERAAIYFEFLSKGETTETP